MVGSSTGEKGFSGASCVHEGTQLLGDQKDLQEVVSRYLLALVACYISVRVTEKSPGFRCIYEEEETTYSIEDSSVGQTLGRVGRVEELCRDWRTLGDLMTCCYMYGRLL